jgi:hypothetical protein
VDLTQKSQETVTFFQRILSPIITAYSYSVEEAIKLSEGGGRFTEDEFVKSCLGVVNSQSARWKGSESKSPMCNDQTTFT